MYVIKPRLTRLREKLNEQLLPMFGDKSLELDFEDPVPENRELNMKEAEIGVKAGYLTVNEGRELTGFDPVASGDVFLIPLNITPITAKRNGTVQKLTAGSADDLLPGWYGKEISLKTDEEKAEFWRRFVADIERQEEPLRRVVVKLFKAQEQDVLIKLREVMAGNALAIPNSVLFESAEWNKRFLDELLPELKEIMGFAIQNARDLVAPENPNTDLRRDVKQAEMVDGAALIWLSDHAATLVTGVNEVTREALRLQLTEGFNEGEGVEKIGRRIRAVMGDATRRRGLLIARTEVIAASAQGAIEGYKEAGLVQMEFFAALDDRVDPDCEALHGTLFSPDEAQGVIPVHPGCRCVLVPVIP